SNRKHDITARRRASSGVLRCAGPPSWVVTGGAFGRTLVRAMRTLHGLRKKNAGNCRRRKGHRAGRAESNRYALKQRSNRRLRHGEEGCPGINESSVVSPKEVAALFATDKKAGREQTITG